MNLSLYGYGPPHAKKWLMVDCGVTFADFRTARGVDLILPDISFIEEEEGGPRRPSSSPTPTKTSIRRPPRPVAAPQGARLRHAVHRGPPQGEGHRETVTARRRTSPWWSRGGNARPLPLRGGADPRLPLDPEPNALAITTPRGLVVHSGDWKIDPVRASAEAIDTERSPPRRGGHPRPHLADLSLNATPLALGLRSMDSRSAEGDRGPGAPQRRRQVTAFLLHRRPHSSAIYEAACGGGHGRRVMGRANAPRHRGRQATAAFMEGLPRFLSEERLRPPPAEKVAPSPHRQPGRGPRGACPQIASDEHPRVALSVGDRVIFSSRTIPGNEEGCEPDPEGGLALQGIEVVTDGSDLVHTSGHPRRDELVDMYRWLKPRILVPVHGEPVHLMAHAQLARDAGIPEVVVTENGKMVRLAPDPAQVIDECPTTSSSWTAASCALLPRPPTCANGARSPSRHRDRGHHPRRPLRPRRRSGRRPHRHPDARRRRRDLPERPSSTSGERRGNDPSPPSPRPHVVAKAARHAKIVCLSYYCLAASHRARDHPGHTRVYTKRQ